MNFILFLFFSISIFLLSLVGYKKYRSTTLYALAIGGAVNANFFHAGKYPIDCFGLPFGIDSIIYTLFAFCVIVMLLKEDKKSAYLLAISSIIAIMFSAFMQLISDLLSFGNYDSVWQTFGTFLVSSIASVIAIVAMLETISRLKNKVNEYVLLIIGLLMATIINSLIYTPLTTLINGTPDNILTLLLTSFIGKIIASACGIFTLFLINHNEKKKNDI